MVSITAHRPWQIDATGQQQRIVVARLRALERHINRRIVVPVSEVPAAHPVVFRRHDLRVGARLVERFARLGKLRWFFPARYRLSQLHFSHKIGANFT